MKVESKNDIDVESILKKWYNRNKLIKYRKSINWVLLWNIM